MKERYFDDLKVGDRFNSEPLSVTEKEVIEFAHKFDPQMFHLSRRSAERSIFKGLIASGWHTAAMTMAVIARRVVDQKQAGLGSPGIDELRWRKPVYPGDTLHVRGEILEKTPSRSRPEIGSFRTQTIVTNQDDEVVMTMVSIVLIRRRPEGDSPAG